MEPGQILGSYTITRKLGEGGTGAVFLAYDTTLHRPVALKVLDRAGDSDSSSSRLLREARNAAALNHPNICTIHEVHHGSGTPFIAMEYVEGRSLRERIDDTGALPNVDVLRFGIHVADALAYAHEHGVVHRDLKAANVMISADGRLKIVDFGLARRDDALVADATTLASMVPAGALAGTPYAMSPEQVRGEAADAHSDVWALGVLLYEMVTGTRPFASAALPELFAAILKEPPRAWPSAVPFAVRAVVERCLDKDPSRRYQQARDVRLALEAIQSGLTPAWTTWRYRFARPAPLVAAAVVSIVAVTAVLLTFGGLWNRLAGPRDSVSLKLAVLPFQNLTGDPAQEYFSDGLTDDVIHRLGRLHPARLRVIAPSSSMRYKGHASPIDAMARELGVDYVLEGSARRDGARVRINATLVQARDRTQLWSQSFDREFAGILTLQNDLARGIAGALALTLLPAEEAQLSGGREVASAAYEAYLMGQSHARRLTRPELDRALQYYETAIRLDPNFALAHSGASRVWAGRLQVGLITREQEAGRADAALARALALDPLLPEGHMALGNRATWAEWDWEAAGASFRRAIDLNPSLAEAHMFHSHYLYIVHRPREGAAAIQRALELDPMNDLVQQFYGMTLRFERRYEDGLAHARQVLQTTPNSPGAWNALAENLYQLHRYDESLTAQRNAIGARGNPDVAAALAPAPGDSAYPAAIRRLADTRARLQQVWVAAQDYIRIGEVDRALDLLERGYDMRNQNMPYISVAPIFDSVRQHPRFRALLQRMQLPM